MFRKIFGTHRQPDSLGCKYAKKINKTILYSRDYILATLVHVFCGIHLIRYTQNKCVISWNLIMTQTSLVHFELLPVVILTCSVT